MGKSSISTVNESNDLKVIEKYLKNYNNYKAGIKNLEKQLAYLIPGIDKLHVSENLDGKNYLQLDNGTYIIDRNISKKSFMLYEDMESYKLIINAIDEALGELDDIEIKFIDSRYIKRKSIVQTSFDLGYSEKYIFNLRKKTLNKLRISLKSLLISEY